MQTKLIVYACPTGPLAEQLDAYFVHAKANWSPNLAHDYMPHVTLTGFFPDAPHTIPNYLDWLASALAATHAGRPQPPLVVGNMLLDAKFHGLEIASPWIQAVIRDFIARAESPTRTEAIRPKDWLHLSLAYGFPPAEDLPLRQLAQEWVDPRAPVDWMLRLYERRPDPDPHRPLDLARMWTCHGEWPL